MIKLIESLERNELPYPAEASFYPERLRKEGFSVSLYYFSNLATLPDCC